MSKKSNDPRRYMDESEKYLKSLFADQGLLQVWRIKDRSKGDMILVGMVDERHPTIPSDIIFLETYLNYTGGSAQIKLFDRKNNISDCSVPFGRGHVPFNDLKELANKVLDVL